MKKNALFLFLFFYLFLTSCLEIKDSNGGIVIKKIDVDITKVENVSTDYFLDSVRYVKLETNPDVRIKRITKAIHSNGRFYILDNTMSAIYVFDKQGRFVYKINHQESDTQKYTEINDFFISCQDSMVTLVDMNNRSIINYKLADGTFVSKKSITYYTGNIINLENNSYLGFNLNDAVLMDSSFNVTKKLLQYSYEIPLPGNDVGYVYKMSDNYGIFSPYDNTVYQVENDTIRKKYIFKYNGMKTPSDYRLGDKLDYAQALEKMKEKGITVIVHRETGDWILQVLILLKSNAPVYALYSKKDEKTTVIGEVDGFKNIWFQSFISSEMDDCLIQAATLPVEELKKYIEKSPVRFTDDFIEIVQNSKENDNPVLQLLYLKK